MVIILNDVINFIKDLITGTKTVAINFLVDCTWFANKIQCMLFIYTYEFQSISHVFGHSIEDISGLRGWILLQDSVLETLWVPLCMIKNLSQNFTNFIVKFGTKAEISWKLEDLKRIFSNNSEVSSYLLGHILLF